MTAYRDELAAAHARVEALELRVKELERGNRRLARRPAAPPEPAAERVAARRGSPDDVDWALGAAFALAYAASWLALHLSGWLALPGAGAIAILYLVGQRRFARPSAAPAPRLSGAARRLDAFVDGVRLAAELRIRTEDPTAARYQGVDGAEVDRVAREVLAAELPGALAGGVDEVEERLIVAAAPRLEALGLQLLSVEVEP